MYSISQLFLVFCFANLINLEMYYHGALSFSLLPFTHAILFFVSGRVVVCCPEIIPKSSVM